MDPFAEKGMEHELDEMRVRRIAREVLLEMLGNIPREGETSAQELVRVKQELNITVSRLIDAQAERDNLRRKLAKIGADEEAIAIWGRFCALDPDDNHDGMCIGWRYKGERTNWVREFFVRQYEESDWCDAVEPAFPTAMRAIEREEHMDRGDRD